MRQLFAIGRRRQLTGFDSGLQAIHDRLVNLCIDLVQLFMDRIAMRANFRAEVSDQAPVAKIGLLEEIELDIEPLAKAGERLE